MYSILKNFRMETIACTSTKLTPKSTNIISYCTLVYSIFRLDWPYDWGNLMPELMERIKYDPQNRALLSMHHVVKSLAGKRLYDSIRLFQDASSQLFPNFYSHWEQRTDAFIKEVSY